MAINKQITICKSATEFIVYPESKNEIGLWVAHTPCFITSNCEIHNIENIINGALQYSNSGIQITNGIQKNVLKELHIKSWKTLYKMYKTISLSLTENKIIITPYVYTQKGVFPDTKIKTFFDICDYNSAIIQLLKL